MQETELTAPCVLVVSDSEDHCAALARQAKPLPVTLHTVADCPAAIVFARRADVAMILIDLQLPMMDGLEAVRQLRAAPRTAHVPIIMIVEGRLGLADRQRGHALGAVSYLQRHDLDFNALQEQMRLLLELHVRANALQRQIDAFLDDQARIGAGNAQVRALQPSLHRHLLQDVLTGLPNRMLFDLHLMGLIRQGARGGRGFALVWIDLDHLKRINQRYRRASGDELLVAIAQRLESVVRSSDLLARIEGDTYGLILDNITEPKAAKAALNKLLAVAGESLDVGGADGKPVTLIPTLSVGVALYPRHGENHTALMTIAQQSAEEVLRMGGDGLRIGWSSTEPPPR